MCEWKQWANSEEMTKAAMMHVMMAVMVMGERCKEGEVHASVQPSEGDERLSIYE